MIKRLLKRLSMAGKTQNDGAASKKANKKISPTVISKDTHGISRKNISPSALKVMSRLNQAGFEGYLVGGGVRDLLLGGSPKDFDIATDATPEQVKTLFRNSRIIGRRFRIVHVRYGREIIEVTTFRGQNSDSNQQVESDTGQLLRDNVYGDLQSDALRRDFTANALYYSAKDLAVYDFANGMEDIKNRQLKMIGDPATRYKEDPVRLLRAVRFAGKLGFSIESNTQKPISEQAHLLTHVPPARLFEEILKLFLGGYATATYSLLRDYKLLDELFPESFRVIDNHPSYAPLIDEMIANTDKRIRTDKRVTPAFVYAALLWPAMHNEFLIQTAHGASEADAFAEACQRTTSLQLQRIMIPKRFLIPMRQIWELQWRLPKRHGNRAQRLLEHPKFRAGYDFLLMREVAGEQLEGLGSWWNQYQHGDEELQQSMIAELTPTPSAKKRRRKPKKKLAAPTSDE
ncbi:MAG: poly(A) polymerase [Pseudohongiellaceae bacterium]|jgi:poly(A) polymerase